MAHRTFVDATGREWQAWEVVPRGILLSAPDRRHQARDRRRDAHDPSDPPGERRRRPDRRVFASADLRRGWLAFQCGDERRRLAPIPPSWADADDATLRDLLASAPLVTTRRGSAGL